MYCQEVFCHFLSIVSKRVLYSLRLRELTRCFSRCYNATSVAIVNASDAGLGSGTAGVTAVAGRLGPMSLMTPEFFVRKPWAPNWEWVPRRAPRATRSV